MVHFTKDKGYSNCELGFNLLRLPQMFKESIHPKLQFIPSISFSSKFMWKNNKIYDMNYNFILFKLFNTLYQGIKAD
jgi:hypothetical protein